MPMKAMKSMKSTMKAKKAKKSAKKGGMKRKAKRVSKVAKGKLRNVLVFRGSRERTVGGLKKGDLVKNKHGRVVSKKKLAAGNRHKFPKTVVAARKALGIKGFCPIGGKTAKGQALLKKARSLYKK